MTRRRSTDDAAHGAEARYASVGQTTRKAKTIASRNQRAEKSEVRSPLVSRAVLLLVTLVGFANGASGEGAEMSPSAFDGIWLGEIVGPNERTVFGLAFTPTPRGRMVSVHFPEMHLYSANFGPAAISGTTFQLPALALSLELAGDRLVGKFAPAGLSVEVRRGGTFAAEPVPSPLPPAPPAAWTVPLGSPAWASPVVADDGVIFVGTENGTMHAVDAEGRRRWQWVGASALYGQAAVTADGVYFVDANNDLVGLARATGALRWRTPLRRGPAAPTQAADPTFNHRTATPVVDTKGMIYVGSADGGICAVRSRNGVLAWRHEVGAPIFSALTLTDDALWAGCFDGAVVRLNRRTHQETLRVKLGGPVVSTPVVTGDRVLVGCRDYQLYGLSALTGTVAWRNSYWFSWVESTPRVGDGWAFVGGSDFRRVSAIDVHGGSRHWATDVRGLSWGTPLVAGNLVLAGTTGQTIAGTIIRHEGGIIALDRKTGAVRWRYEAPARENAPFSGFAGSLALAGENVIGAGLDGVLIALPINSTASP